MKQLILQRHAKSDWSDAFLPDHDRPLNKRGRATASDLGLYFTQKGLHPDLVLCSTAKRTQETLARLQKKANTDFQVCFEHRLYGASPETILSLVREQDDELNSIMIVGHNPAIEDLATSLIGEDESNQLHLIHEKVPTGSLILLDFPVDRFAHISLNTGLLRAFIRPKHELLNSLSSKSTQS